ncbi:hypothetical protein LTR36_007886 [Oleoguttula mirabilis]|uniref:Methyltransferase domain-containing protein n=1 Tax=Oleoguttula mirabilis TaxID=1507867 RepID=A0AAV9J9D3_9PEZI|nr:hypothetical protein LTR36_007886 [Oleoguttula mirabilis]
MQSSGYSAADTFDDVGEAYQVAFDRVPAQVRSLDWILTQLPRKSVVLDVGCGTGKPACEMLAGAGHNVTGIDISPKMIEVARRQLPSAKFMVADSRVWEPPHGEAYDGIVSYFSWIAGVKQNDIRVFFQRAYGWLKPGGAFVFGTVTVPGEDMAINWMGRDVIASSLNAEETIAAIKEAGFVVEKDEREMYLPRVAEAGLCDAEDAEEEPHLFVYARKAT